MTETKTAEKNIDAVLRRAARSAAVERWSIAHDLYETVLKAEPENTRALIGSGMSALKHGNFPVCVHRLTEATRACPQNELLFRPLGYAQRRLARYDFAIEAYSRALELEPNHAGTHNNLGEAYFVSGDYSAAKRHFETACELKSGYVAAIFNLANVQKLRNNPNAAQSLYRRVLELNPAHSGAHYNLARLHADANRYEEAIDGFREALRVKPKFAEAAHEAGHALAALNRDHDAMEMYKRACELAQAKPDPLVSLTSLLRKMGRDEEAGTCYRTLLALESEDPEYLFYVTSLAWSFEEYDKALDIIDRAIEARPDNAVFHNLKATVLFRKHETEAACRSARRAIELDPEYAAAHGTLAACAIIDDDFVAARRHAGIAIELDPELPDAHALYATSLVRDGELDEASIHCMKALDLDPECQQAKIMLALINVANGRLSEGWRDYELRLTRGVHARIENQLALRMPRWEDQESIAGREIVAYGEEGVGDQVLQASCLPDLLSLGPRRCVVVCEPRLVPLFERAFDVTAYGYDEAGKKISVRADIQNCDRVVAMASLFVRFRNRFEDFPNHDGYLSARDEAVAAWRDRYSELGEGPKVGISWRGGGRTSARVVRSTNLLDWLPILATPGAFFINLQYGDCGNDLQEVYRKTGVVIHDWADTDPLLDLDGFAARIAALDLVISIDNSTVHFAGALGVRCWVMLPYASSWIWLRGRDTSVWYPSLRLFRQQRGENWDTTIRAVARTWADFTGGPLA